MSKENPVNIAASVRQKLLNWSHKEGEDFQQVLTRYALERLVYRLSRSRHANAFVLKGAMLFFIWNRKFSRVTRDLDFLGFGDHSVEALQKTFQEVAEMKVEADGMVFPGGKVRAAMIREEQIYGGVRVQLEGRLAGARIPLQIDVGFGDVITPDPEEVEYPVLLEQPAPRLRAYPKETVVAEKLEAMVKLGMANSRMKDFYDLHMLAKHFTFDGAILCSAIEATFARRKTPLPQSVPLALTQEFAGDTDKQKQWAGFLKRSGLSDAAPNLPEAVKSIHALLENPLHALAHKKSWKQAWPHGGPWTIR